MKEDSDHICFCCLQGLMPTISKKWAICIILSLGRNQMMRFCEIMGNCGHMQPPVFTDRDVQPIFRPYPTCPNMTLSLRQRRLRSGRS